MRPTRRIGSEHCAEMVRWLSERATHCECDADGSCLFHFNEVTSGALPASEAPYPEHYRDLDTRLYPAMQLAQPHYTGGDEG